MTGLFCRLAPVCCAVLLLSAAAQAQGDPVDRFVDSTAFNGVLLAARNGEVLTERATGHADFERGILTTPATRYQLGSISKWVSSVVVLALVDRGVLALDAPVVTYLPEYAGEAGQRVTLHHLLSHTSGIPNDVIQAFRADPAMASEDLTTDAALVRYASSALAFAPGTRFDYSHSNWIVVKAVVERATGQPFAEVVADVLTRPLGLGDTGTFSGDFAAVPGAAVGYTAVTPEPAVWHQPQPAFLMCAGGIYSTAR
ncbi:MAG TPA: serine hydrolase domain-containing protein, partial [Rubricoccaceae bacterium]